MDKANSKILTLSFAIAAIILAFTLQILITSFAGAFGVVARMADSDFVRHILPALIGVVVFLVLQFNSKILTWGDEVVMEIRRVVWPSRKDTTAMTIVTIIMVIISGILIASFDFISGYILNFVMR